MNDLDGGDETDARTTGKGNGYENAMVSGRHEDTLASRAASFRYLSMTLCVPSDREFQVMHETVLTNVQECVPLPFPQMLIENLSEK